MKEGFSFVPRQPAKVVSPARRGWYFAVNTCGVAQECFGDPEHDDGMLRGRLSKLDSLLSHLSAEQRVELTELMREFPQLFGHVPSRTWVEHDIDMGGAPPIKQRFYHVSPEKLKSTCFKTTSSFHSVGRCYQNPITHRSFARTRERLTR